MTDQPHFDFQQDERGGVTVLRDGHPQSHVDLHDRELLALEPPDPEHFINLDD